MIQAPSYPERHQLPVLHVWLWIRRPPSLRSNAPSLLQEDAAIVDFVEDARGLGLVAVSLQGILEGLPNTYPAAHRNALIS
jgi:hypothetical protein